MQQTDDPVTRKTRLRLWLNLLRTTRFVENRLREDMRLSYDLTLPRFEILAMLQRSETGLRMTDLSSQLMVSNGNVTGIVDRLVEDGLVERVPVPGDKRASLVRLTYKGEAVFAEMADVHERWVNELLDVVTAEDADHMINRLNEVRKKARVQ